MKPGAESPPFDDQVRLVTAIVQGVLGPSLEALYLYGSAVEGGLHPNSDLDFLALSLAPTKRRQRLALVERLTPISARAQRPPEWRPVEVTIVAKPAVYPWRYPPRTDFQYGEWLRERFAAGDVEPEDPLNPDLAILLAMVRSTGRPLVGPSPDAVLPDVPGKDLRRALVGVVPALMADVESDTANVLLTLARCWFTLETGRFASKDAAADWMAARVDATTASLLERARDVYLGAPEDRWDDLGDVGRAAGRLRDVINRRIDSLTN